MKNNKKILALLSVFIFVVCFTVCVTSTYVTGAFMSDFSEMTEKELNEYGHFAEEAVDEYQKLLMSDYDKWFETINCQAKDDESVVREQITKVLEKITKSVPDSFSDVVKRYMAANIFYDVYGLSITDTRQNLIASSAEIDSYKIIGDSFVCKINSVIKFKYSDQVNDSISATQIQLVIKNAENPVIVDWYCDESSSFDACVRTYGLDLFDKNNWLSSIKSDVLEEKILQVCMENYESNRIVCEENISNTTNIPEEDIFKGDIVNRAVTASSASVPFDNWMSARIRAWYYASYILNNRPGNPIAYSSSYSYVCFDTQGGYDCTNFVSHCLLAGRFSMKSGTHKGTDGWFFNSMSSRSATWSSVKHLYNFIINNTSSAGPKCKSYTSVSNKTVTTGYSSSKKPQAGDVLQIKYNTSAGYAYPNFGHSTIISSIDSNNNINVSYRSDSNHYGCNVRLSQKFPAATNTTSGSGGHLYRVVNIKYYGE